MSSKIDSAIKSCRENGIIMTLKKAYRYAIFRLKIKKPKKENEIYKLSKNEVKQIKLKTKNRVFIFATMPYSEKQKMALLANTFNSMGYLVKYFYTKNILESAKQKNFLPVVEYGMLNLDSFSNDVQNEDICIFENDDKDFLPFKDMAINKGCRVVNAPSAKEIFDLCCDIIDDNDKCDSDFYDNISIVILNYNNKDVIEKCLDTILKFNDRYKVEIIVVDNQSKDGSYELLQEKYSSKIKLFRNEKNGCSSGRNLGVKYATKKYVLFLDSDQWVLHKYWLEPYIEILKKDMSIGAIGWAAGWFNKEGYSYNVVDSFPFKYMPPMGLYRSDIGYLGTGGLIISRELFNKVGGFDLYYDPTCYEDTDLSLKVRNAGFELAYTTYLGVGHMPHQSTKAGSKEHNKLIKDKGDYFVFKWKKLNPKLLKYIK